MSSRQGGKCDDRSGSVRIPPHSRFQFEGELDRVSHYLFRYPAKFHPPIARTLLAQYTRAGDAFSFFAQTFAPRQTSAASVWGFAPGWQREIGFFDLAMALIALLAIRTDDLRFQRCLTLGIVVLTTLVGTNHLVTILSGKTSPLHEVFAVVNYAAVGIGCAALFSRQGRSHNGLPRMPSQDTQSRY
jgi:hypothetical protein